MGPGIDCADAELAASSQVAPVMFFRGGADKHGMYRVPHTSMPGDADRSVGLTTICRYYPQWLLRSCSERSKV
jgi:hypothetical protein